MKYKIEINLFALSEMNSKISLEEAVLLDYLYWLCTSPSEDVEKMRIEKDGYKYTWFDYGHFLKEVPILRGKTKASITPKIKKLEEEGFIKTIIQDAPSGGDRKYVRLLPKCDYLFRRGSFRKLNEVVKKTKRGSFRKLNEYNNINIDNNIIDNNNNNNILATQSVAGNVLNQLLDLFKGVNPSYKRLFSNKTQRAALERLVKEYGVEKIENLIKILPQIIVKPYAPKIITPLELERDLGKLIAFIKQEKSKVENKNKIASI